MRSSPLLVFSRFACLVLAACAGGVPHREPVAPPGFAKSLGFESHGLGLITSIETDPDGVVLAVGNRGAANVSAAGEVGTPVAYQVPGYTRKRPLRTLSQVEPIRAQGERMFLSRGGGWQEVGIYDAAGNLVWSYKGKKDEAPDWLTACDVDGDGALEYFVGMNGDGGLRRIDPGGRTLWQVADRNVWRIEAVQADADPELEIVHSDEEGKLVVRGADGRKLHEIPYTGYAWQNFDVLRSAGAVSQIVVAARDELAVLSADGSQRRSLPARLDRTELGLAVAARGLRAEGGTLQWEWLAALSRMPIGELAVLSIHDADGRLVHEEVLPEACASVAWSARQTPELLVGCNDRVWRYRPGSAQEPVLTAAQFERSGGAFGPLSFGDSPERVMTVLGLEGAECRNAHCGIWAIRVDGRDFVLKPQYESEKLVRVTLFGPRRERAEWSTQVRADWSALVSRLGDAAGDRETEFPPVTVVADLPPKDGWSFSEPLRPQREGVDAAIGLYRNDGEHGSRFGAIAVLRPSAPEPASPPGDAAGAPASPAD